jgi:DNA-directed RNA polymerase subunit RPC12/RpoP
MDHSFCPGARILRQPKPESIKCTTCGGDVEIWSDESRATCPSCKATVVREGGMSCLDWCKMGKECVGEEIYNTYMAQRSVNVKQQILAELELWFGEDARRIAHAKQVMHHAEELLRRESADWHIVVPAAILHDVGIKVAEEKYGSAAGRYQEIEGPPVVRKILLKIGLGVGQIDEICAIVAHHHSPGKNETRNFEAVYDADCLVNIGETVGGLNPEQRKILIDRTFLTAAGREMAADLYLQKPEADR